MNHVLISLAIHAFTNAEEKPEFVAKAESLVKAAHADDANWPIRDTKPRAAKK